MQLEKIATQNAMSYLATGHCRIYKIDIKLMLYLVYI